MSSSMKDGQKNCLREKGVLRSSMLVVQPQPVASLALRAHSHSVTFVMNKTWLRGSVISSKTNCRLPQKQHKMLREMRNALERRNQSMTPRHHHQSLKVSRRARAKLSPKERVHQRTIHSALARRPLRLPTISVMTGTQVHRPPVATAATSATAKDGEKLLSSARVTPNQMNPISPANALASITCVRQ